MPMIPVSRDAGGLAFASSRCVASSRVRLPPFVHAWPLVFIGRETEDDFKTSRRRSRARS
jgi:hypothetical protein